MAGNVNTGTLRRMPVVTEVCALYVREARINGMLLKEWLLSEWKRTGLPLRAANEACGVKNAATRKYLDQSHLWYFPPPDVFARLAVYANQHGKLDGRPYFSLDGKRPMQAAEWQMMRSKFRCPFGWTNVWEQPPVHGAERLKSESGKAAHLNQKPLALMKLIIEASSEEGDVIWEPFGGLLSASVAAYRLNRIAYAGELDSDYYNLGGERLRKVISAGRVTPGEKFNKSA